MILIYTIIIGIIAIDINFRTVNNYSLLLLLFALLSYNQNSLSSLAVSNAMWSLIIGLILHKCRVIGGGDIKLLAILSLFIEQHFFPLTILIMAWSGGIVAAICWLLNKVKKSPQPPTVPYAVPICIAGIFGLLASS